MDFVFFPCSLFHPSVPRGKTGPLPTKQLTHLGSPYLIPPRDCRISFYSSWPCAFFFLLLVPPPPFLFLSFPTPTCFPPPRLRITVYLLLKLLSLFPPANLRTCPFLFSPTGPFTFLFPLPPLGVFIRRLIFDGSSFNRLQPPCRFVVRLSGLTPPSFDELPSGHEWRRPISSFCPPPVLQLPAHRRKRPSPFVVPGFTAPPVFHLVPSFSATIHPPRNHPLEDSILPFGFLTRTFLPSSNSFTPSAMVAPRAFPF